MQGVVGRGWRGECGVDGKMYGTTTHTPGCLFGARVGRGARAGWEEGQCAPGDARFAERVGRGASRMEGGTVHTRGCTVGGRKSSGMARETPQGNMV